MTDISKSFKGFVPAVMTVCNKDGKINYNLCAVHCKALVERGADALFIGGSTGELSSMNTEERNLLVKHVVEAVDSTIPVAMGISGCGAKDTILNAELAAANGAALGIAMPPYIFSYGKNELKEYFHRIADESPIPIGIYHRGWCTGLDADALHIITSHPRIQLLKYNTTERNELDTIIDAVKDNNIILLQGREPAFEISLQSGCDGFVSALGNIVPEWHREILDAYKINNNKRVARLQEKLNMLLQLFRQPECTVSFSAWNYTLRYGAFRRGWLPMTYNLVPGFIPKDSFVKRTEELWDKVYVDQPASLCEVV